MCTVICLLVYKAMTVLESFGSKETMNKRYFPPFRMSHPFISRSFSSNSSHLSFKSWNSWKAMIFGWTVTSKVYKLGFPIYKNQPTFRLFTLFKSQNFSPKLLLFLYLVGSSVFVNRFLCVSIVKSFRTKLVLSWDAIAQRPSALGEQNRLKERLWSISSDIFRLIFA